MKKLMITAALAALTTGAFAGVPQVYEMTLNVKTTVCKKSNSLIKDACNPEGHYFYRAQTSYKFKGLFWGCGCPVIAQPNADQYGMPRLAWVDDWSCDDNSNSYMFWGPEKAFHHTDFKWEILQLVGQKTSNIEGTFDAEFFACDNGTAVDKAVLSLRGAGYGTATVTACADEEAEDIQAASLNQIKSMSGSIVGYYDIADGSDIIGCKYCGVEVECAPYPFCPCVAVDTDLSSAFGTFTLKFHSSAASKVGKGKWIDEAYSFPKYVISEFECIAAGDDPEDPTVDDKLRANYLAAVQAVNVAKEGVIVASNATVEAVYYSRQVNGGAYSTLQEVGETKTKQQQYNEAQTKAFDAYDKAVKDSGYTHVNDFVDDILASAFHGTTAEWTTFKGYADTYVTADNDHYVALRDAADAKAKYEAKTITKSAYQAYEKDVTDKAKILATAKADLLKAFDVYTIADKVQESKDKTHFMTYYNAYVTLNEGFYNVADPEWAYNEWTYEQSWKYDAEGGVLSTEQLSKQAEDASKAATEAQKVCSLNGKTGTAPEALDAAEDNLKTAETACLIATGNKECK